MSGVDDEVLLARAYLSRVAEPAHPSVWNLVREFGPVDAARAIRRRTAGTEAGAVTEARAAGVDPRADLDAAARHDIRLVVPESPDWPHFAIGALERAAVRFGFDRAGASRSEKGDPIPPLALWVRGPGDLTTLGVRAAGVVGSRTSTSYGDHVTTEFGYGLARAGVDVVSGGAYGIDAAAHRSALAGGGRTVLVSAGGLDRPYPSGNASLFERVAATGLLVSESPPGAVPQRRRFLTRNRLIAAFSTGVVVVEAAQRSGAANTARHAGLLGRPLMAVPGPVTSAMSRGCHQLLRREPDPALLVETVDDVLAVVGAVGSSLGGPDSVACSASSAGSGAAVSEAGAGSGAAAGSARGVDVRAELDRLEPSVRQVFEGLPARTAVSVDALARRSGVAARDVLRALPTLQIAGLAVADADGRFRLARRRKDGSVG